MMLPAMKKVFEAEKFFRLIRARQESIIMNEDGSSVITERVCSRTEEHNAMDIESDGNADLNM